MLFYYPYCFIKDHYYAEFIIVDLLINPFLLLYLYVIFKRLIAMINKNINVHILNSFSEGYSSLVFGP